jgi:hypothetical protein
VLEEGGSVNQKRGLIGTLGATGLEERLPEQQTQLPEQVQKLLRWEAAPRCATDAGGYP